MTVTRSEERTCPACGAVHVVTFQYSQSAPINPNYAAANCRKCGRPLVQEKNVDVTAVLKQ